MWDRRNLGDDRRGTPEPAAVAPHRLSQLIVLDPPKSLRATQELSRALAASRPGPRTFSTVTVATGPSSPRPGHSRPQDSSLIPCRSVASLSLIVFH